MYTPPSRVTRRTDARRFRPERRTPGAHPRPQGIAARGEDVRPVVAMCHAWPVQAECLAAATGATGRPEANVPPCPITPRQIGRNAALTRVGPDGSCVPTFRRRQWGHGNETRRRQGRGRGNGRHRGAARTVLPFARRGRLRSERRRSGTERRLDADATRPRRADRHTPADMGRLTALAAHPPELDLALATPAQAACAAGGDVGDPGEAGFCRRRIRWRTRTTTATLGKIASSVSSKDSPS